MSNEVIPLFLPLFFWLLGRLTSRRTVSWSVVAQSTEHWWRDLPLGIPLETSTVEMQWRNSSWSPVRSASPAIEKRLKPHQKKRLIRTRELSEAYLHQEAARFLLTSRPLQWQHDSSWHRVANPFADRTGILCLICRTQSGLDCDIQERIAVLILRVPRRWMRHRESQWANVSLTKSSLQISEMNELNRSNSVPMPWWLVSSRPIQLSHAASYAVSDISAREPRRSMPSDRKRMAIDDGRCVTSHSCLTRLFLQNVNSKGRGKDFQHPVLLEAISFRRVIQARAKLPARSVR